MKVKLISTTINPELIISMSAKLCYSNSDIDSLMEKQTEEKIEKFINRLISLGHESPLEHVSFTFAIEGISRACSHQLVRHRIASYSQQSQRYIDFDNFDFIIPPQIEEDAELKTIFIKHMKETNKIYKNISEKLINKNKDKKKSIEDARYVLPNACSTKIIMTMNLRSLQHFFNERCCSRAQWEIRNLANEILKICKQEHPILFKNSGAKCEKLGYCPEGTMSCGKYPLKCDAQ